MIDFDKMDGLAPGIVQDARTGEVLMLGFLNPLRGSSGKVFFTTVTPGSSIAPGAPGGAKSVLTGGAQRVASDFTAPEQPGVYLVRLTSEETQKEHGHEHFSAVDLKLE